MGADLSTELVRHVKTTGDLSLADRELLDVPADIKRLHRFLMRLDLSNNLLEAFPRAVKRLDQLHSLNLSFNRLTSLGTELRRLPLLNAFIVAHNKLSDMDVRALAGNLQLTQLDLSENQLIGSHVTGSLESLPRLRELNLSRNPLGAVPATLLRIASLHTLRIDQCALLSLPSNLGAAVGLEMLSADGNQITELPASIAALPGLTTLSLANNALEALPERLPHSLTHLNVAENRFAEMPACVCALTALRELDIGGNHLTALPEAVRGLVSLEVLHARVNAIESLPDALGDLRDLRELSLVDNSLRTLPAALARLAKLESLELAGNPLPADMRFLGTTQLLQRLRMQASSAPGTPSVSAPSSSGIGVGTTPLATDEFEYNSEDERSRPRRLTIVIKPRTDTTTVRQRAARSQTTAFPSLDLGAPGSAHDAVPRVSPPPSSGSGDAVPRAVSPVRSESASAHEERRAPAVSRPALVPPLGQPQQRRADDALSFGLFSQSTTPRPSTDSSAAPSAQAQASGATAGASLSLAIPPARVGAAVVVAHEPPAARPISPVRAVSPAPVPAPVPALQPREQHAVPVVTIGVAPSVPSDAHVPTPASLAPGAEQPSGSRSPVSSSAASSTGGARTPSPEHVVSAAAPNAVAAAAAVRAPASQVTAEAPSSPSASAALPSSPGETLVLEAAAALQAGNFAQCDTLACQAAHTLAALGMRVNPTHMRSAVALAFTARLAAERRRLETAIGHQDLKRICLLSRVMADQPLPSPALRIVALLSAVERNRRGGNWLHVARLANLALPMLQEASDRARRLIELKEEAKTQIKARGDGSPDENFTAYVCPQCNLWTSSGERQCTSCGGEIRLCHRTLQLIVGRFSACTVCKAVFAIKTAIDEPLSECDICGSRCLLALVTPASSPAQSPAATSAPRGVGADVAPHSTAAAAAAVDAGAVVAPATAPRASLLSPLAGSLARPIDAMADPTVTPVRAMSPPSAEANLLATPIAPQVPADASVQRSSSTLDELLAALHENNRTLANQIQESMQASRLSPTGQRQRALSGGLSPTAGQVPRAPPVSWVRGPSVSGANGDGDDPARARRAATVDSSGRAEHGSSLSTTSVRRSGGGDAPGRGARSASNSAQASPVHAPPGSPPRRPSARSAHTDMSTTVDDDTSDSDSDESLRSEASSFSSISGALLQSTGSASMFQLPKASLAREYRLAALSHLDKNNKREALAALNQALRNYVMCDDPESMRDEVRECVRYKMALRLLEAVDQATAVAPPRTIDAAFLARLLCSLQLEERHRIVCLNMALRRNLLAENYGVAMRFIQLLLHKSPAQAVERQLRERADECRRNKMANKAVPTYTCWSCETPSPLTADRCTTCSSVIAFCSLTFQVLERDELMRCPFCEALYDSVALQRQGGVTDLLSARCLYCSYRPLAASSMGEVAAHAQAMGVLQ